MKLILCGKGGCGKSTLSVLLAREFERRGKRVLVIDSDESNFGLHALLGVDLPEDFIHYYGGKDTFGNRDNSKPVFDRRWQIEDIPSRFLSTDGGVSLMAIGKIHKAGEGCACSMGTLARCFLENLDLKDNDVAITDTEAGIEHLGRGVDKFADILLVVLDPSLESVRLAKKIDQMGAEFGRQVCFVLNRVSSKQRDMLMDAIHRPDGILGCIETDEDLQMKSLMGIPLSDPHPEICRMVDCLSGHG